MTTNAGFLGAKSTNAFRYQKFGLSSITVYLNGYPIAGTHLIKDTDKKIPFAFVGNSRLDIMVMVFLIPIIEIIHYLIVFDLTSNQQRSHDYIHPELTNAANGISLLLSTALENGFFFREKKLQTYIDSNRKVSKNLSMQKLFLAKD